VQGLYERYDFWAVFLAGLTPIPYKVFTLSSGVFRIDFGVFVLASVLSRGLRFFAVAGLIYKFGPPIARFIDRYFDLLAIAFSVLLVGGFLVIKFVF
jgi:membrane protein DedA with SNARE-associated domain